MQTRLLISDLHDCAEAYPLIPQCCVVGLSDSRVLYVVSEGPVAGTYRVHYAGNSEPVYMHEEYLRDHTRLPNLDEATRLSVDNELTHMRQAQKPGALTDIRL